MEIVAYTVPQTPAATDTPKQNLDSAKQRLGRAETGGAAH